MLSILQLREAGFIKDVDAEMAGKPVYRMGSEYKYTFGIMDVDGETAICLNKSNKNVNVPISDLYMHHYEQNKLPYKITTIADLPDLPRGRTYDVLPQGTIGGGTYGIHVKELDIFFTIALVMQNPTIFKPIWT